MNNFKLYLCLVVVLSLVFTILITFPLFRLILNSQTKEFIKNEYEEGTTFSGNNQILQEGIDSYVDTRS
jgi:uncharacterized protein YpmS